MAEGAALFVLTLGVLAADARAIPRAGLTLRSAAGTGVLLLVALGLFGLLLGLTGAWFASALLVVILAAALTLISNIKYAVLGEPLVFTDFALFGAVFQHPQFYISALRWWQIAILATGFFALAFLLVFFSTADMPARLIGLGLAAAAGVALAGLLRLSVWAMLEDWPNLDHYVREHGLIATLLVGWRRWRKLCDPAPCDLPVVSGKRNQLIVIVQCESFADPAELFADSSLALPGLEKARSASWQSGRLNVTGFGAYTMRTEYGVLFGRSEDQLGLRRFDPFLTAQGEVSWALPHRLSDADWTSVFIHPHDLRFYGRQDLMRKAGFDQLMGADAFALPHFSEGRYVTDDAVCSKILEIAQDTDCATLIYAVTIENHGPWPLQQDQETGEKRAGAAYLRLLEHSDAMLARLLEHLPGRGRPVTLCFFGDHRPSIPKISEPGLVRHTPYVLISFGPDGVPVSPCRASQDITPAQLHHMILGAIQAWECKT